MDDGLDRGVPSRVRPTSRQRGRIVGRLTHRGADEGRFDREFWRGVSPARRLELVWEMVEEAPALRGEDASQPRLQRSVQRIQRR